MWLAFIIWVEKKNNKKMARDVSAIVIFVSKKKRNSACICMCVCVSVSAVSQSCAKDNI